MAYIFYCKCVNDTEWMIKYIVLNVAQKCLFFLKSHKKKFLVVRYTCSTTAKWVKTKHFKASEHLSSAYTEIKFIAQNVKLYMTT